MRLIIFICLLGLALSCRFGSNKYVSRLTYKKCLKEAFERKDTSYVLSVIDNLSDTAISDVEYYDMLVRICQLSGFYYGNLDARSVSFKHKTQKERMILRQNTAKVMSIYSKSCFFLQYLEPDVLQSIEQDFWKYEKLSSKDLDQIKRRFDLLCRKQEKIDRND
ncbi:hypothetical protein CLV51_103692 [Chitinophaga niastensis]|uniref:Lipoprotein n=1 Tax=Chitinophaga niastensis TaxID=536980 RepID=A0A2P8HKI1_CHINA|nr:hypothetical protein [Chitinophaga niastensis]PSL46711.1 hypothetical protein CLV51_103692 [Chitinophaga niastensis]